MEGDLVGLTIHPGDPAQYVLNLGETNNPLNELLGCGVRFTFLGTYVCQHCRRESSRSFGRGYCYDCFTSLARCDLCVVSPTRCHFHLGTCREPDWGQGFCMQPHIVYLANSAGPKVGLTRLGRHIGRWLEQGATQGLVIAQCASRKLAGEVEEACARWVSDKTDWRRLVSRPALPHDLPRLRETLINKIKLPAAGISWVESDVHLLNYPVARHAPAVRLDLDPAQPVLEAELTGLKGPYMLFATGVLNVAALRGARLRLEVLDKPPAPPEDDQLQLFQDLQ